MKKNLCGIYKITCVVNGKCYIGQSTDIRSRWFAHRGKLRRNKHNNKYLQNLWNKYGEENMKFEIVEECPIEIIDERERYWINFYGGVESTQNCNWESGGHKNKRYSKEHREAISKRYKGKSFSPDTQFKKGVVVWNKGKKATPLARLHQSESHKGLKVKEETKLKISKTLKGKIVGGDRYNAKKVLKIDINGNVVAEYSCIIEAAKAAGISNTCLRKRTEHSDRLYDNHYWKIKEN